MIFDVLFPVFFITIIGVAASYMGMFKDDAIVSLNNYVYYFALPAFLFYSLVTVDLNDLVNLNFIGANLGGIFASFLLAILIGKVFFKKHLSNAAIMAMSSAYGNTGYMGVALLIIAYGQEVALPAVVATIIHNIPVIVIVSLLIGFSGQEEDKDSHQGQGKLDLVKQIFHTLLTNPINIAFITSITILVLNIKLPTGITAFFGILAKAAAPTALFALGLSLARQARELSEMRTANKEIVTVILLKLFIQPLVTTALVIWIFPLEKLWAITAIVMSATPVGAAVYVFALKYKAFAKESSIAIFVSMIVAFFTLSLVLTFIERLV